jgi:hypothetical protein
VKIKGARICLVLSIILFVSGMMVLCDCTGMFVLAGIFSLLAVVFATSKRVRITAGVMLLLSLIAALLMRGE